MLIERGVERLALRELADQLEIKLGNLQYYFKTKDALVLQVMEAEAERDRTIIKAHVDGEKEPAETLRLIVRDLITRWRGDSGVLLSTLGTLAIHHASYRALYRSIYSDFYVALEVPIRRLNPDLSESELGLRVRMITALIDGAPMQPQLASKRAFLKRVQAEAEAIAVRG